MCSRLHKLQISTVNEYSCSETDNKRHDKTNMKQRGTLNCRARKFQHSGVGALPNLAGSGYEQFVQEIHVEFQINFVEVKLYNRSQIVNLRHLWIATAHVPDKTLQRTKEA